VLVGLCRLAGGVPEGPRAAVDRRAHEEAQQEHRSEGLDGQRYGRGCGRGAGAGKSSEAVSKQRRPCLSAPHLSPSTASSASEQR
jgi:hypothetical protein